MHARMPRRAQTRRSVETVLARGDAAGQKEAIGPQAQMGPVARASRIVEGEHPFHVIKNLFRHKKVRYKGLAKNIEQLFSLFGLANLVIAKRSLLTIHTRDAS
jgi:IS5 family transposase